MTGLLKNLQQLGQRRVLVDGVDVGARHHHVVDAQFADTQDAQEHIALLRRQHLAALAFLAQGLVQHVADGTVVGIGKTQFFAQPGQPVVTCGFAVRLGPVPFKRVVNRHSRRRQ